MYLYHYYDRDYGPFKNLSELTDEEAVVIVKKIAKEKQEAFCNKRKPEYMQKRRYYENIIKEDKEPRYG